MTTRNKIAEQVERLYMRSFQHEQIKKNIDRREVALLIDQATNALLSLQVRQAERLGSVDIPSCMIATYPNVAVTGNAFTLPAYPITLKMDIGVWAVRNSGTGIAYIPMKTEFWDLLRAEDEGLLEGQIGFFMRGRTGRFTDDVAGPVDIELLITDPSLLGEFDPYPIPADMEIRVVEAVVGMLSARGLGLEKAKG